MAKLCFFLSILLIVRISSAHFWERQSKGSSGSLTKYSISKKDASKFLKRSKRSTDYQEDRTVILEECREGCDDEEQDEFCRIHQNTGRSACACNILKDHQCRYCRARCVDVHRNCYNLNAYQVKCVVDGGYSQWINWSPCSVTCGRGIRYRRRYCNNPRPSRNGGKLCPIPSMQFDICSGRECPRHGGLSSWNQWSSCSVTCGGGQSTRSRLCNNPVPAFGGRRCPTYQRAESRSCNNNICPVDGGFSNWNAWSSCSVTCGNGTMSRNRTCNNPSPAHRGRNCSGDFVEESTCNPLPCAVDGGFTGWSEWSLCSLSCGNGTKSRYRTCTSPRPAYGGRNCSGDSVEIFSCNPRPCPVDGGFTNWNAWSVCSVSCGNGTMSRSRTCTNPRPAYGGSNCSGDFVETLSCNPRPCPVDGGFSNWNAWSSCSVTCGEGRMSRNRSCTNPRPAFGGQNCSGDFKMFYICNPRPCPVDGGFTSWNEWSDCSVSCGNGTMSRSRTCSNPTPAYGGRNCSGDSVSVLRCNPRPCPVDGGFAAWSEWRECSVTCGGGVKRRSRSCSNPRPAFGGQNCTGLFDSVSACNPDPCPIDGGFTDWSSWSSCSTSCGGGSKSRRRSCSNPRPQYGGQTCFGLYDEVSPCNTERCPICEPGEFECGDETCISDKFACDGYPDCNDGSDELCDVAELCPEGQTRCPNGGCVSQANLC